MFIQFPEGEANATHLTPDEFYDRLKAMYPAIPTTAQPSPGIFAEIYRKLAADDKDIFSDPYLLRFERHARGGPRGQHLC